MQKITLLSPLGILDLQIPPFGHVTTQYGYIPCCVCGSLIKQEQQIGIIEPISINPMLGYQ